MRKLIFDRITGASGLPTILIANGYATDVAAVVVDTRSPLNQLEYPAVMVSDLGDTMRRHIRNATEWEMVLDLKCFTREYIESSKIDALMILMADVEKFLHVDETWNGYAIKTDSQQLVPSLSEDAAPYGTNAIRTRILYRTIKGQPTQQAFI